MKEHHQEALELDRKDSLARFRDRFVNDDRMIYLDGNSLGKLPRKTVAMTDHIIRQQWGDRLIRSWNETWLEVPRKIAAKIASLVGAQPDEIFVGDSTSINLYKLAFAALQAQANRKQIVTDGFNFPTDLYVLQGLVRQQFKDHTLDIVESADGIHMDVADLKAKISDKTALVTLSHVAYKSAFMYDMQAVNDIAHENGSLILWDLSHSAGAVPINLNETNTDLAIGCTYKYFNGGPGAPAFLYVRKDLQEKLTNPIFAWLAHERPFDFNREFEPSKGIQKFAVSTPHILSMAPIEPGLDILLEAGMENVRAKSVAQSAFLIDLAQRHLVPYGFKIASPLDSASRGSHVSLTHKEGYRITKALIEPQYAAKLIIPDFRPPNYLRLGISPLYTSYSDIFEVVQRTMAILGLKEHEQYKGGPIGVP